MISVTKLKVSYKYVLQMSPAVKTVNYFIDSVSSKWKHFNKRQIELHVSPFYEVDDSRAKFKYVWQIVYDFDKNAASMVRKFLLSLSPRDRNIFIVERTCNGLHLVSKYAFYPVKDKDDIENLRKVAHLLHADIPLDLPASIRHLPIRRTPSGYTDPKKSHCKKRLVYALPAVKFLHMSLTEVDLQAVNLKFKNKQELEKYLLKYTLPSKIVHFREFDYTKMFYEKLRKVTKYE